MYADVSSAKNNASASLRFLLFEHNNDLNRTLWQSVAGPEDETRQTGDA